MCSLILSPAAYAQQACQSLFDGAKSEFNFDREEYIFISKLFPEGQMTPELYKVFKAATLGPEQMFQHRQQPPKLNTSQAVSVLTKALTLIENEKYQSIIKKLNEPNINPLYPLYTQRMLRYLRDPELIKNHQNSMNRLQLSFPEFFILNDYTMALYYPLNQYSRAPELNLATFNYLNRYINQALDKLPNYSGSVRRDLQLSPEDLERFKNEKYYVAPSFMSTTKREQRVFQRNCIFLIKSKTGKDISQLSNLPAEQEILFKQGTKFEIIKFEVDQKKQSDDLLLG